MKILIVGLGVIGASFAKGLKKANYNEVYGVDICRDTLDKAEKLGIIKRGYERCQDIIGSCDFVIIAIYPKLIKNFIEENQDFFKKNAVITDVTGIKEMFIHEIEEILPRDIDFVFGHPMAGREKKGIDFSTEKVFKDANYIITPTKRNREENIKLVENIARELGFKRIEKITAREHDKMIGFTSQLPHAIAVALINSDDEKNDTGAFIGDSYRDLTRIANINEELWSELFLGNKVNLLEAIIGFECELNKIKEAIIKKDKDRLERLFKESSRRREMLEK